MISPNQTGGSDISRRLVISNTSLTGWILNVSLNHSYGSMEYATEFTEYYSVDDLEYFFFHARHCRSMSNYPQGCA